MLSVGDWILIPAWLAFLLVWVAGMFGTARTVRRGGAWDRVLIAAAVLLAYLARRVGAPFVSDRFVAASTVGLAAGALLTYAGVAFAIWARVHLGRYWSGTVTLKEGHRLIRTGPYRIVRNPIYTGILAAFLGAALVEGTIAFLLAFVLMVAAFVVKILEEEKLLREQFGDEFAAYEREVPRLVPGVW